MRQWIKDPTESSNFYSYQYLDFAFKEKNNSYTQF